MKCDLCGSIIDQFSHSCSCGHGICNDCHEELKSNYIFGFPQCFWWSCEFYGMVKVPEFNRQYDGITLNAQRFGALSGWTTELAEDSIVQVPEMMFSELANAMAEQEERAMIQGDLTLDEFAESVNTPVTPDNVAELNDIAALINTGAITYNEARRRLGLAEVDYNEPLVPTEVADTLVERVRWQNHLRQTLNVPARQVGRTAESLTVDELNNMIESIEDQGHRATSVMLSPETVARLRETSEFVIGDRRRISFNRPNRFMQDMDEIRVTERVQFAPENNNAITNIIGVNDID